MDNDASLLTPLVQKCMYDKGQHFTCFLLQMYCHTMPKIEVTFNKTFLVPIYGFKPTVSSFTLIFPKERHLGKEKKKKKKQSC